MEGRESKESNDIFYVCSFIDYFARQTKNTRTDTINMLGKKNIEKLYALADIYHCQSMEQTMDEFSQVCEVSPGNFDNVADCDYAVPDYWDIGRVYNNLIMDIANERPNDDILDILFEVYNSWITNYIDDYNSNMYYSNPGYIFQSYKNGSLIAE